MDGILRHNGAPCCGAPLDVQIRSGDHAFLMGEGREEIRWQHAETAETALGEAHIATSKPDVWRLGRIQRTGVWMPVLPSNINGIEFGAQELRDFLFLRYGIEPPDLLYNCDGCGAVFSICHALDCKNGGLITAHHNKLRDGVANLGGKAFTPVHVRDDPIIFTGCAVQGGEPKEKTEGKGMKTLSPE